MIVKPTGTEQEDRLHAMAGSVLDAGTKVRSAGKTARRVGWNVIVYYMFGIMMFGLMFSRNPIWFKALLGAGMYLLFRLARRPKPRSEELFERPAADAKQISNAP